MRANLATRGSPTRSPAAGCTSRGAACRRSLRPAFCQPSDGWRGGRRRVIDRAAWPLCGLLDLRRGGVDRAQRLRRRAGLRPIDSPPADVICCLGDAMQYDSCEVLRAEGDCEWVRGNHRTDINTERQSVVYSIRRPLDDRAVPHATRSPSQVNWTTNRSV